MFGNDTPLGKNLLQPPSMNIGAESQSIQRAKRRIRPQNQEQDLARPIQSSQNNPLQGATPPPGQTFMRQSQPQINPYQARIHQNQMNQQRTLQPPPQFNNFQKPAGQGTIGGPPIRPEDMAQDNIMSRDRFANQNQNPNLLATNPAEKQLTSQLSPEQQQQIQQRELILRQRFGDMRGIMDKRFTGLQQA